MDFRCRRWVIVSHTWSKHLLTMLLHLLHMLNLLHMLHMLHMLQLLHMLHLLHLLHLLPLLLLLLLLLLLMESVKDGERWWQLVVLLLTSAGGLSKPQSIEDGRGCWWTLLLRAAVGELCDLEEIDESPWWWLKRWLHRSDWHSMLGLAWRWTAWQHRRRLWATR